MTPTLIVDALAQMGIDGRLRLISTSRPVRARPRGCDYTTPNGDGNFEPTRVKWADF